MPHVISQAKKIKLIEKNKTLKTLPNLFISVKKLKIGGGRTLSDCRDRAELERIPQPHRIGHKSIGQGRRGVGIKIMGELLVEGQTLGNRNAEAVLPGNAVIRNGSKEGLVINGAAEFQGASMHLHIQIGAGTPIQ